MNSFLTLNSVNQAIEAAQVQNNAGGFVYQLSDFDRFKRFLILGSNSNTYYASQQKLTVENATVILKLLNEGHGEALIAEILTVSIAGRAPKQAPGLFALAVALVYSNAGTSFDASAKAKRKVRKAVLEALPKVCRTASTLYEYFAYYKVVLQGQQGAAAKPQTGLTGFGHSVRKTVSAWFLERSPEDVAFQVTKYPQRHGISARDLLRLAHPRAGDLAKRNRADQVEAMALVLKYAAHPSEEVVGEGPAAEFIRDAALLKKGVKDVPTALQIIQRRRALGWEHMGDTKLLKSPRLWAALIKQGLGMTALLRNLRRFQQLGLLGNAMQSAAPGHASQEDSMENSVEGAEAQEQLEPAEAEAVLALVCSRLVDEQQLKAARVHPLQVLMAQGALTQPDVRLSTALELAFERAFANVTPTGKRVLLALDVSGSMMCPCVGAASVTCAMAAAAIAMILARKEADTQVFAFSHKLTPFPISPTDSLAVVMANAGSINFGATDCSLPIIHAREKRMAVDAFIILTDNETWRGEHAASELRKYRAFRKAAVGESTPAKLLVGAFASTGFTIADPEDPGMLDIAGLDASFPQIMASFLLGEL